MIHRLLAITTVALLCGGLTWAPAGGKADPTKAALQELNEYIGLWKGSGTSEQNKSEIWPEEADWSWRFKGKDAWITLTLNKGKHFKSGELRYVPSKEVYRMTMLDKANKEMVFEGTIKKNRLTLERTDPQTDELQQIQMFLAAEGIRFLYVYQVKPANRTLFTKEFQVAFTKVGESFGPAKKRVECIVTGGLGTIPVTFMGQTYYVCCSGCRDAFAENPAKYVAEAKKKQ